MFDPNYLNLAFFFRKILDFFEWLGGSFSALLEGLENTQFTAGQLVFWAISALLVGVILYIVWKHTGLRAEEESKYGEVQIEYLSTKSLEERNIKWQRVLDYLDSPHESDWRLAIIEADTMLDEVLDTAGYVGDTLGEKLKGAVAGDFRTVNEAWEAHKMRNQIAHADAGFRLSKHEAERTVDLFRAVFEEFHYI